MKFKEILVSKGESAYKIIKRLKEEGELENAWLMMNRDVNEKMKKEEKAEVYAKYTLPSNLFIAIEIRHYRTQYSIDTIEFKYLEEPERIIFMKLAD